MDGDQNTNFFNGKANQRRKTNTIKRLKDMDGKLCGGATQCERERYIAGVCIFTGKEISDSSKHIYSSPFATIKSNRPFFRCTPLRLLALMVFPLYSIRNTGILLVRILFLLRLMC